MSQDIISSFQRYEVKYFLTPRQREHLLPELEEHFKIDQYGLHTISNIYYDTDNYAITRDSIDRPVYKEKTASPRLWNAGTDDRPGVCGAEKEV